MAGVSTSAAVGVLSLISGIVVLPFVIDAVGSGPYGIWLVLITIATYFHYSDLGVGSAIVHFGSRARAGADSRSMSDYLSAALLWNCGSALIVLPLGAIISLIYVNANRASIDMDSSTAVWLVILSTVALSNLIVKPFVSTLTGSGLLPIDRRNQAVAIAFRFVGTLVVCALVPNVIAVAVVETVALLLPTVLAAFTVRHRRLAEIRWNRKSLATLKYMFAYSTRSFGVAAVGALILQSGTVIVGVLLGPSQATYYNAAFRVYSSVRQVVGWVVDPFRSTLSRLFAIDPPQARDAMLSLAFLSFGATSAVCASLALASTWLVDLWLGSQVPAGAVSSTMSVLLVGLILNSLQIPLVPAGDASGRPGAFFGLQVSWLVASLSLTLVLTPRLGILGAALGLSLPLLIVAPLYGLRARSVVGLSIRAWLGVTLKPTALVVIPSLAIASSTFLLMRPTSTSTSTSLSSTVTFMAASALLALLLRRRLPIRRVMTLLRTAL